MMNYKSEVAYVHATMHMGGCTQSLGMIDQSRDAG
jgi:hypothetical protein